MSKLSDQIKDVVQNLDIDYGDYITEDEIAQLIGIKKPVITNNIMTHKQVMEATNDYRWTLLHCIDLFKTHLRTHRKMYLKAMRKNFTYRIIHPNEHAEIAMADLQRGIKKAFQKSHDVLESCEERALNQIEKTALVEAQVKISRVEGLMNRQLLRQK